MAEVITGVIVFSALCLTVKALRLYGVVGLAILSMIMPWAFLVLGVTAGIAYLLFFHRST